MASLFFFPAVIMFAFSQQVYNVGEGDFFTEVCIDQIGGVTSTNVPVTIITADGSANGKHTTSGNI